MGPKNPSIIAAKCPTNFPAKNQKIFTDELLQERRENIHYTQLSDISFAGLNLSPESREISQENPRKFSNEPCGVDEEN